MDATVEDWVRVCAVEDIPLLGSRVLKREGGDDIALFRPAAARVFALADRCPHKGGPLSQGIVSGDTVTCPVQVRDGYVWLSPGPVADLAAPPATVAEAVA